MYPCFNALKFGRQNSCLGILEKLTACVLLQCEIISAKVRFGRKAREIRGHIYDIYQMNHQL